jgi:hypothetical protein
MTQPTSVAAAVRAALDARRVTRPITMANMSMTPAGTFTRRTPEGVDVREADGVLAAAARDLAAQRS